jgi:hypothetical protein
VGENIEKSAAYNEAQRSKIAKDTVFERGDLVLLKNLASKPGISKKLQPIYIGPYRIIEKTSPVNFKIRAVHRPEDEQTVHSERFRPYKVRSAYLTINDNRIRNRLRAVKEKPKKDFEPNSESEESDYEEGPILVKPQTENNQQTTRPGPRSKTKKVYPAERNYNLRNRDTAPVIRAADEARVVLHDCAQQARELGLLD